MHKLIIFVFQNLDKFFQMKNILWISLSVLALSACKKEQPAPDQPLETPSDTIAADTIALNVAADSRLLAMNDAVKPMFQEPKYASFGKKITADKALSESAMLKKYESMKKGDTVSVKFKSNISSVCKKKGCWMKMDLAQGKESFVRFKDYEFFVPLNADNSKAIVSGKAYVEEISVDEQRHYAKDGGKSQEEINKITKPKVTYAFMADGVLIQQ